VRGVKLEHHPLVGDISPDQDDILDGKKEITEETRRRLRAL